MMLRIVFLFIAVFGFSGQVFAQTFEEGLEWQDLDSFLEKTTVIKPGDKISVNVENAPKISREYIVSDSGVVDFPEIGTVAAATQTPTSFGRALEFLYGRNYLDNPSITVTILGSRVPDEEIADYGPAKQADLNSTSVTELNDQATNDLIPDEQARSNQVPDVQFSDDAQILSDEVIDSSPQPFTKPEGTLGPDDRIFVNVKNVPEVTGQYIVDETGSVDMPYIGKVSATAQTPESFAQILKSLYDKNYLVDPTITVTIFAARLPDKKIVTNVETVVKPEPITRRIPN